MIIEITPLQVLMMFFAGFVGCAGAELCKALIIHAKKKVNHVF